jgi:hypothetical protein
MAVARRVRRDPPLNEPNDRVAPMARHFEGSKKRNELPKRR